MAGDEVMIAGWPLPATDGESAGFWAAARRGTLAIQSCVACGRLRHPPRPMCPWCRSLERTWTEVSGHGSIWSYVVPHPPLLPALSLVAPYNVIVVALSEDPTIRLVGNLVTSPESAINELLGDAIDIGAHVRALFVPMSQDVALVRWAVC
jgi:uncharacterized OB-fold protein